MTWQRTSIRITFTHRHRLFSVLDSRPERCGRFGSWASLGLWLLACALGTLASSAQAAEPVVAIHDSELTRALDSMPATGTTPSGTGTTGKQWWLSSWKYFVMPDSLKEALRSDGTPFRVVQDSNIVSGLLTTNGVPRYPILISLACEAVLDQEIAELTNYVAAGGFLFVGSSSFTRFTNGSPRGDFAIADAMGVHAFSPMLTNWTVNQYLTRQVQHRLVSGSIGSYFCHDKFRRHS